MPDESQENETCKSHISLKSLWLIIKVHFTSSVRFSSVCFDVEFVINSALADDGASFASKHVVTVVFAHKPAQFSGVALDR